MRAYSDTVKVKTTKTSGGQTVLTEAGQAMGSASESKQVT
jgi:hypothetical protein